MNSNDTLNITSVKRNIPYGLLFILGIPLFFIFAIILDIFFKGINGLFVLLVSFIIPFAMLYLYTDLKYKKTHIHSLHISPMSLNIQYAKNNVSLLWDNIQFISYMFYIEHTELSSNEYYKKSSDELNQTEKIYIKLKKGKWIIFTLNIDTQNQNEMLTQSDWRLKIIALLQEYTQQHQIQLYYCGNNLNDDKGFNFIIQNYRKSPNSMNLVNLKNMIADMSAMKIPVMPISEHFSALMVLLICGFLLSTLIVSLFNVSKKTFISGNNTEIGQTIVTLSFIGIPLLILWIVIFVFIIKRIKAIYRQLKF